MLLVTRVVAWAIVLSGLILGLGAFEATLTSQITLRVFEYLPNVVTAILVDPRRSRTLYAATCGPWGTTLTIRASCILAPPMDICLVPRMPGCTGN